MFKTVSFTAKPNTNCVMLLGGFDGLHVGHRQLLARAKEYGLPVGVMSIVGGKDGSLFTLSERERIFAASGVDFAVELPFLEIKGLSATEFVQKLEEQFAPVAFVCGEDFRFGRGAEGSAHALQEMTSAKVDVLPLLEIGGEKVSSSTVKALLSRGELCRANELLGEPFFLTGKVGEGRKVGRTIGFPTANIVYPTEKYPIPFGVYETQVDVGGKVYRAITNFGAQPTFLQGQVCVETHLDGFCGNLYGREITVFFVRKLRDIRKFESVDGLQRQLQSDLRSVREDD